MSTTRKIHSAEFKAKVALEAIRGYKTTNELASEYGVHPVQIAQWKKMAVEELPQVFGKRERKQMKADESLQGALYEQIGKLQMELEWLKKKAGAIS